MENSRPTYPQQHQSPFTAPEIEAALQLIQLSGESDVDVNGNGITNSTGEVSMKVRRKKEVVYDHDESQGSCNSEITSAPPVRRFVGRRFETEDDDGEDGGSDVAGSRRRKRKKFRLVSELYKISRQLV